MSVVASRSVTLASSPARIWPAISDTDRLNRVLSEPIVTRPIEAGAKTAARFVARTRAGGFALEYEEAPFEWVVAERFRVYRKMRGGPLASYTYSAVLEPTTSGGTNLTLRLELVPRHWALRPIVRAKGERAVARISKLTEALDRHLTGSGPNPFAEPRSPANAERLRYAARELSKRGLDERIAGAVLAFVEGGSDADLVSVRPFELAERLGLGARETLRVLLHGVTLGIFELRWALVCPSCRVGAETVSTLAHLGETGHCQLCDITWGVELDRAVEATFRPHPAVRDVPSTLFCVGGPFRTPHVLVQANLDDQGEMEVPRAPGRYRLFARGGAVGSLEITEDGPASAKTTLRDQAFAPATLSLSPSGKLTIDNERGEPVHVKIEHLGYATRAATAHVVTTMSEFRRLFSKDLLKTSTPLRVGYCAILFTDLTGSTALYTRSGDAAAFRFVDDHFDVLRCAIDETGGAVVKTMGDAVMAAFTDAGACARAAVACLRRFEAFRATTEDGHLTGLKLGLFAGPCYVITANEAIDYFGQTVNCASRVQHLAASGELLLETRVFDELPEPDRAALDVIERFETQVKGVDAPLALVRARLATA